MSKSESYKNASIMDI